MATSIQRAKRAHHQKPQNSKPPLLAKSENECTLQNSDIAKVYADLKREEIEISQTTLDLLQKFQKFVLSSKDEINEDDFLEFWGETLFDLSRCIEKAKFNIHVLTFDLQKSKLL